MASNSLKPATPSDHPLRSHPVARASDDLSAPPSPANSREEDRAAAAQEPPPSPEEEEEKKTCCCGVGCIIM
ncbi:hypothetical protein BLS_003842 [Venturia inaequalis]|uniref:Uncharacterized protein n=1 Tax=Venturia inaequalis TaxID=5025 RepID=A0A8H3Z2T0_VENIN|nr:hypothetical protein BLS_003842 [Venturia inaequalis]